jgi:hypothetical protein
MGMDLSGRRLHAIGALVLSTAVLLFGRGAVLAQETAPAYEEESFQQKVVKGVLGAVGLDTGANHQIDYRERAPLVIPPTNDLPPPESAVARPPEWPNDPGQHRRRKVTAKKKNSNSSQEGQSWLPSLSESKKLVDGMFGHPPPESTAFRGEPERSDLTEPPEGYQVPSPSYPYGINNATKSAATLSTPANDGLLAAGGPLSPGAAGPAPVSPSPAGDSQATASPGK